MSKWEYKTVTFETTGLWGGSLNVSNFDNEVNKYGQDGWEMVSCFATHQAQGKSSAVFAVFKREIEDW
ncbi:hypothetical protein MmiAt1_07030 [Methanimicrococcus sp. At1]|uniref:DUF4177 domain-containing protein n=1 Tax=Methanimicrococcus hacksteinii TaxID=3028293 RepID=A0ABU3VPR7_9EURY|nr:DUF4177 domain-containing protein [Methanimicrococcus sp. At1]MDV0445146.1 hypothetical protein [Methanimicrococcus sp. At1]